MRIRRANVHDCAALAHVQVDSYRAAYAGIFPRSYLDHFRYEEQEQDWRDLLSSGSGDVLYVAETEPGEVVGYGLGRAGPTGIPAYDGELVALHVRPAYHGQGLGRRILAAVAAELQRQGCTALMLWTLEKNPAQALYEQLGGQRIGEKAWDGNQVFGTEVTEVAYGWPDAGALAAPAVVGRMQRLIAEWEREANPQAIFLSCYQRMTSNVLAALKHEEFQDPKWVHHILDRFADYYFEALEAYERDPATAPPVWQLAHDTAHNPHSLAIENLMLGVNAHINYDLVLTLVEILRPEWDDLSAEERAARYQDHCYVNEVLARTIDAVQDEVLEPAMPALDLVDKLMGPLDEFLISRLITQWRDKVWRNAVRLLEAADPDERASVLQQVEEDTLKLGRLICLRKTQPPHTA
jgi:ribosomal protein S18 acetylase RimI-like enzyme